MNVINYQRELNKILEDKANYGKTLFLHSCCAPCSSYVLTYLSSFFRITVFYYNPNITNDSEYEHRVLEQKRLIEELNMSASNEPWAVCKGHFPIAVIDGDYDKKLFYDTVKGYENEPEGGARCALCFKLRLEETYNRAKDIGADYFGTTLTISPLKNANVINNIGYKIGDYAPMWLPSDFKKQDGYKHSIELSVKYDLYRQNYCGCEFSRNEGKIE